MRTSCARPVIELAFRPQGQRSIPGWGVDALQSPQSDMYSPPDFWLHRLDSELGYGLFEDIQTVGRQDVITSMCARQD